MTNIGTIQKENKWKTLAIDMLVDLIAGTAFGISVNVFTAPNHIAPGGVTGFATLMNYIFGIPIGLMSFLINVPLLLIGVKVLGKDFFFRTFKSVVIINFAVDVIAPALTRGYVYTGEKIMAGLMGGVLMGACIGMVLQRGSTTGGLDVVSRVVKKKMPQFSIGKIMFAGDFTILAGDFLEDRTVVDGRRVYTHERLRRARSSLSSLVSAGTLFTYLDPDLAKAGPLPSTNNMIEGGVHSQLRAVLRNHRGLTSVKRVKAVFWWCHAHSGDARTAREKLATMPTDADIDFLFSVYSASPSRDDGGPEWGDRAVWEDLHHRDPYPFWLD